MLSGFFKKRNNSSGSRDEEHYRKAVDYLISQVSSPSGATSIILEAKNFKTKGLNAMEKDFISIYLLFERYCCDVEGVVARDRSSFREAFIFRFPNLNKNANLKVIYRKEEDSIILLAARFLHDILLPVKDLTGNQRGNVVNTYMNWIDRISIYDFKSRPDGGPYQYKDDKSLYWNLKELSHYLFDDLSRRFGQINIQRVYQRAYEGLNKLYRDFEHFPHIIQMMPSKILKQDHLRLMGRSQIQNMLITQVEELQSLNKRLEDEVERNEQLRKVSQEKTEALETILRTALDAVITIDQYSNIISWNKKAAEIFGYSEEEAKGQKLQELIVPAIHKDQHQQGMARYLQTGTSKILNKRVEIDAINKEGKHFPIDLSVTEVIVSGTRRFTAFIRDLSAQKEHEANLLNAKRETEEISQFKNRFFANMSHEIRTPLSAILGFTSLMSETDTDKVQKEYLELIESSGKNLLNLINDILELSKMEQGELQINPEAEFFEEKVREILSPYENMAHTKNLDFNVYFQEALPKVVVTDYFRLGQVLINLIGNAIKFTEEGGITVNFKYNFEENGQFTILVRVADSGKGVETEKINSIFESFRQEHSSIANEYGGTGLGLSISREIVQALGGEISAKSPSAVYKDKGTDFTFNIQASLNYDKSIHDGKKVSEELEIPKDLRLLLVEDNPLNQKLMCNILDSLKIDVTIANDGVEALEVPDKEKFDIIFMDIQMPRMDGYETTRELKKLGITAPIIAISANVYQEDIEKSREAGMVAHLGKPFRKEELINAIVKFTAGQGQNQDQASS